MRMKKVLVASGALLAVAAATAGIASALIPSASKVISGCYDSRSGALRVIDVEAGANCATREKPITWNQQGPTGPQGVPGPQGSPGTPGISSAAEVSTATATMTMRPIYGGALALPAVQVPAGPTVISATLRLTNNDPSVSPEVTCYVITNDSLGRHNVGHQGRAQLGSGPGESRQETLTIQATYVLPETAMMWIECGTTASSGSVTVSDASVIATRVGAVTRISS